MPGFAASSLADADDVGVLSAVNFDTTKRLRLTASQSHAASKAQIGLISDLARWQALPGEPLQWIRQNELKRGNACPVEEPRVN
jgi:hypothetical protein